MNPKVHYCPPCGVWHVDIGAGDLFDADTWDEAMRQAFALIAWVQEYVTERFARGGRVSNNLPLPDLDSGYILPRRARPAADLDIDWRRLAVPR